jgi:hypothetical protein
MEEAREFRQWLLGRLDVVREMIAKSEFVRERWQEALEIATALDMVQPELADRLGLASRWTLTTALTKHHLSWKIDPSAVELLKISESRHFGTFVALQRATANLEHANAEVQRLNLQLKQPTEHQGNAAMLQILPRSKLERGADCQKRDLRFPQ